MLRAVPLLSTCNKKELRQIANLGTHLNAADGAVLTEQGQPGHEFFLLLHGAARCYVDGALVANLASGDFFGEMALLDRGPRHATVVAEGTTELIVLDGREFDTLLDTSPAITKKLLFSLAERARSNATARS
jgi:CPA1 family monovalent cation:H+ antiporter